LASGSWDNTIKLWSVKLRTLVNTLPGHNIGVLAVAFSPDGKYLASGIGDNTIKLWDFGSQKEITTLQGHIN
jgi:WD40 repeat protein